MGPDRSDVIVHSKLILRWSQKSNSHNYHQEYQHLNGDAVFLILSYEHAKQSFGFYPSFRHLGLQFVIRFQIDNNIKEFSRPIFIVRGVCH